MSKLITFPQTMTFVSKKDVAGETIKSTDDREQLMNYDRETGDVTFASTGTVYVNVPESQRPAVLKAVTAIAV